MNNRYEISKAVMKGYSKGTYRPLETIKETKALVMKEIERSVTHPELLLEVILQLSKLQAYYAPHERKVSVLREWLGLATKKDTDGKMWQRMVTYTKIEAIRHCGILYKEQTLAIGTDGKRIHIAWDVSNEEGYEHSTTEEHYSKEDFETNYKRTPNIMSHLPCSYEGYSNDLGLNGKLSKKLITCRSLDEDSDVWVIHILMNVCGEKRIISVNEKHWKDALSIFEGDVFFAVQNNLITLPYEDWKDTTGTIRLDGKSSEGVNATSVLLLYPIHGNKELSINIMKQLKAQTKELTNE